jgi:hypothetical protein
MSKKTDLFIAASNTSDLAAQIRIARTEALDQVQGEGLRADFIDRIDRLAGRFKPGGGPDGWSKYCRHLDAAFALGIAIGQLVHPDAFSKPGSRSGGAR